MLPLVRIVVLFVLAVALLAVAGGIVVAATGLLEKAALMAVAVLIVLSVSRVRRSGHPTAPH